MATATNSLDKVPEPELTGTAKAAALLLAMNRELAGKILKYFDEEEVKIIAQSANDLGAVTREILDKIIEEFADDLKSGTDLTATAHKIQGLLEGVLSPDQIAALLAQTGTKSAHAVWQHLQKIAEPVLTQYLAREHPQVIAIVLSRAEPNVAGALLRSMPRALNKEVVGRMLSLRPVTERPLTLLEMSFIQDLLLNRRSDADVSPHTRMADIINKMDRKLMDDCLNAIASHNEKDAELIKQQLFTFEDLVLLTPPSLVAVFDSIQPDTIMNALYGITPALQEQILQAVPARARRAIEVELAEGPKPKPRETMKAQRAIADVALTLLERGTIEMQAEEEEAE
jgi:flagellar motor switch protein FliG